MEEEKNLKETADGLMKKEGDVKGEVFRTHSIYIEYREGEEGLKRVEKRMEEIGHPFEFKKIKPTGWYKEALSALVILTAKDVFNWTEEDLFKMGNSAPNHSFIVRMFIKHFLSVKDVFEKAGQYWNKHYNFGGLEKVDFNEEEKYIVVRLKDYNFHPLVCGPYFKGYFTRIVHFSIKTEKVEIEEQKCFFRGDPYNEYIIRWS